MTQEYTIGFHPILREEENMSQSCGKKIVMPGTREENLSSGSIIRIKNDHPIMSIGESKETIGFHPKPRQKRPEDIYRASKGKRVKIGVRNFGVAEGLVKETFGDCLLIDNDGEEITVYYKDFSMWETEPLIIIPESY